MVTERAFSRDARIAEEERGSVVVTVLVVREVSPNAESVAAAAELAVRRADWEPYADKREDGRGDELRQLAETMVQKPRKAGAVDEMGLETRRRAIAYGRARGNA